jgi:hypothetical protein
MSAGPSEPGAAGAKPTASKRWIPFWVLQVAELAVAFVFVDVAVHLTSQGSLLAAAGVLALLAVTARGPLGIVRLCPRPLHALLVVVASGAIALSPLLSVLRPDLTGIVVLEIGAVGMIRLATLTRTTEAVATPAPTRATAVRTPAPVETAEPSPVETAEPSPVAPAPVAPAPAEPVGQRSEQPELTAVERSARTAGAAAVAGRQAVERYRPVAEDQARRALRGAGRSVGRMLRRASPPPEPPA